MTTLISSLNIARDKGNIATVGDLIQYSMKSSQSFDPTPLDLVEVLKYAQNSLSSMPSNRSEHDTYVEQRESTQRSLTKQLIITLFFDTVFIN